MRIHRRQSKLLSLLLAAAIILGGIVSGGRCRAAIPAVDDGLVVVSIGDSYSAGEGLSPFYGQDKPRKERVKDENWLAHRSTQAWAGQLTIATASGERVALRDRFCEPGTANEDISWYFAASTGAKTEHLTIPQEKFYAVFEGLWHVSIGTAYLTPQLEVFNGLTGNVDYVTVTIGGNDAHFVEIIASCLTTSSLLTPKKLTKKLNKIWEEFFDPDPETGIRLRLIEAYTQICEAAGPQACVIVVGYPPLLSDRGFSVSRKEASQVNEAVHMFNQWLAMLVEYCRVKNGLNLYFVSVEKEFEGHEAYSEDPYIFPLVYNDKQSKTEEINQLEPISGHSFHPNEKGAAVYAAAVQRKIDELEIRRKIRNGIPWIPEETTVAEAGQPYLLPEARRKRFCA